MNRRLVIWICGTLALLAVTAGAYRRFAGAEPDRGLGESIDANDLWRVVNPPKREEELKSLEGSLKQNPDHAPILLRMAQLKRDMGKLPEAVEHLREAVKADPKNRDARLELGRLLFDTGDVQGAIRETEQLLELDPANVDGLYNLGAIYGNLGQDDRARQYWRKAAATAPDSESGRRAREALKQIGG
jgi:tetratricopeptide (TPR) repeat protein